jgi:hypothetical protein
LPEAKPAILTCLGDEVHQLRDEIRLFEQALM